MDLESPIKSKVRTCAFKRAMFLFLVLLVAISLNCSGWHVLSEPHFFPGGAGLSHADDDHGTPSHDHDAPHSVEDHDTLAACAPDTVVTSELHAQTPGVSHWNLPETKPSHHDFVVTEDCIPPRTTCLGPHAPRAPPLA